MDYEIFKINLLEGIKEFYREAVNVEYDNVLKNNGQYCDALRITDKESGKVIPVIYIEKLYEKYLDGELGMKECVLKVCKLRKESECPEELQTFVKQLMKWDVVKDKIYPILISLEHNQELLKELVYTQMLDLAVIYAVRVKLEDGECGIVKVSKDLLWAYEINENQLHDTAMDNLKTDGYRFQKINDLIGRCLHPMKLKENEVDQDKLEKLGMYVLINSNELYGAAGILNKELIKEFAGDRDFYILPSSLHETIFVLADNWCDYKELDAMIREINENVLDQQEVLADHCYYYDGRKNEIRMCA